MIGNYFKIAWRNLNRFKSYAIVNITGLAVGLTGFIIILLYLNFELSYDKWDPSLKRVYKISVRSDEDIYQATPPPLSALLRQKLPFIEAATTMQSSGEYDVLLSANDKKIYQKGGVEADSNFLRVFPFQVVDGDASTSLNKPNAVLIRSDVAQKLFGTTDVIGKTLKIHNVIENEITAVFTEPVGPSHFQAAFVYRSPYEKTNIHWQNFSYQTYIKTKEYLSQAKVETAADEVYYNERLKQGNISLADFRASGHEAGLIAEKVEDIHNFPKHGNSNFTTVTVLLLLAVLLLLSGAINFSNLSIAASVRRAKEVGVRKVLGSGVGQLRWQFMSEIALQCFISLFISIGLVVILLPYFNQSFGLSLRFFQPGNISTIAWQIVACLLVVILLSGLYPAFFLSKYNISKVLKGDYSRGKNGTAFRNALVVVQFTVATFFITGTLIVRNQMQYMQEKDRGFSASQVMRLETSQKVRDKNFEQTRETLLAVQGVKMVSKTTAVPGDAHDDTSTIEFRYAGEIKRMASVKVSADYFSTLNIKLVTGRLFDGRSADVHTRSAVINETAARKLHLKFPSNEPVIFPGCDSVPLEVIGIVQDFNTIGFESKVQPTLFSIGNNGCIFQSGGGILVKLDGPDIRKSVAGVEAAWKTIDPEAPIRFSFLDDNFQKLFASHIRLQKLIGLFSLSAILISLLGLFALTTFLVSRRTKEIGIRKLLGASLADVAVLVSKDFVRLILIAVIIALPLAWMATHKWLQTFSYRVENRWDTFLMAACIILLLAVITTSLLGIKAARANPAKSLRTE